MPRWMRYYNCNFRQWSAWAVAFTKPPDYMYFQILSSNLIAHT